MFRLGIWPFGRVRRALKRFAGRVKNLEHAGDTLVTPPMPRGLYALMANSYWKIKARKNGVPLKRLPNPALGPGEYGTEGGNGPASGRDAGEKPGP
jgi:hypothetical protein